MKVKIHREGTNILLILLLVLAVVNTSAWLFIKVVAIPIVFTAISAVIYLLVLNFYRSPRRRFDGDNAPDLVVSSVDGKVVAVEETVEPEYLKCRCIQLSVFMSPLNVHANWFPVNGKVLEVRHFAGRFMSAFLPKSSIENEHSSVLIRTHAGPDVVVNQVAGALARRIVTYPHAGDEASIEQHMGFIKLGSRVDIYLPLDAKVLVKVGDKTVGGITPVACLPTTVSQ